MKLDRLHKWIALPLSLAVMFSVATPALATGSTTEEQTSSYEEVLEPEIQEEPTLSEESETAEESTSAAISDPDPTVDTTQEIQTDANETAAEPKEDAAAASYVEIIADDYDASEGDVHNTINASQLLPESPLDDSPAPFASYNYATELAKFPASYQTLLKKLHQKYPNWIFIADQTGISFASAVKAESNNSLSYLSPSACSSLMSSSVNNTYANSNTIAFYMDPRNYLNEKDIFLFADINSNGSYTAKGVESVISGTNLSNSKTYYGLSCGSRVSHSLPTTFANTILNAGSTYKMNPYFLGAKIITETGGSLSLTSTSGQNSRYPNIYNFYNIGAYTGAVDGLKWASTNGSYSRPWKTPTLSINGGSSMIYTNYYKTGQGTIYYTRFNTGPKATYGHYTHQYMSSLYGGVNEAERMYKGYSTAMNGNYIFHIPVYSSMPSTCSLLSVANSLKGVVFTKTTKKGKTTASAKLRSGPASTYKEVITIPSGKAITISGGVATNNANKAQQIASPYWFKASYGGETGYISADLVSVSSSYSVAKGKTRTLAYTKANSSDTVYFLSSNTSVATVSTKGVITGKKNGTCMIYAFCGGGFDAIGITVSTTGTPTTTLSSSNATFSLSYTTKPYTGSALKPATTVKYGSKKLTSGVDYVVSYSNNKEPGIATVKITGTGDYAGSLSKTFKITALTATYRTTSKVNYRSGCGTNYALKGTLADNKPVQVVYGWYKTVDGVKWHKVLIGGTYYYMSGNYLKREVLIKYKTKSAVNYYSSYSTSSTKKGQFKAGTVISIVKGWNKTVGSNTWYQVKVGSSYYYLVSSYLTKYETIVNYTTKEKVNVRSAAGTCNPLKTYLMADTPVSVIKGGSTTVSGDVWYRIKINGSYYYMMASYLTKA